MIQQQYPSQLLERAVSEFSKFPGIGRKTALRLVLWLLRQENNEVEQFADAVSRLKQEVKYCHVCHNIRQDGGHAGHVMVHVVRGEKVDPVALARDNLV